MNTFNHPVWNDFLGKKLLLAALSLALMTHGVIIYFTLPRTYDAFVHMFFADHYARFWFEPWDYRWYTGFLTISYPPLVHQVIALMSKVFPLKVAFSIYATCVFQILIVGAYRFSKLFFDKSVAGVAALLTVVLSSLVETLHVYGQVPTLTGLAFLLNALPFLYQYLRKSKPIYLVMALSFLSVVICAHHVTAIFGLVFFVVPTIVMALADGLPAVDKPVSLVQFGVSMFLAALRRFKSLLLFGGLIIVLAVGLIFPYWYWSKTDPITQVSIPHGSRDNFMQVASSGLIFFIIPLGLVFALLPAIGYTITRHRRFIGWAVSFSVCLLLGSGGTTPLPKLLLGANAFNILTLDRFGLWASIIAIPFMAKFIYSFLAGEVGDYLSKRFHSSGHFMLSGATGFSYLLFVLFIFHLGSFRPLQPKEVDIQPILNFLNRDEHMRWRYLTLGFGDQMAWLSANTLAASVDGNYHSARRLPELTTRPVERLENAKYAGDQGLASLTDFLSSAEKYSLKYVFSNDRFYDPLLYFNGWNRTIRLENGIMVWEKGNISTIKPVVPKALSTLLKRAWGILPVGSLCLAVLLTAFYLIRYKQTDFEFSIPDTDAHYPSAIILTASFLPMLFSASFIVKQVYELLLVDEQKDPTATVTNFFNHLDLQRFETAFYFFKPSPDYTIDQYMLEKSVTDGGLLPSYAKLEAIQVNELTPITDSVTVQVATKWRTAVGHWQRTDTMHLTRQNRSWYIVPPSFRPEIPAEQMRDYPYVLFKKQGKRVISSFPTVKDDRIKKPFAAYKQVNFVRDGARNFLTGEVINADDIPVNIALKVTVRYQHNVSRDYYPGTAFQYNLAPKASSFFQIPLDDTYLMDSLKIESVDVYGTTDVSERGYIHGGTVGYSVRSLPHNEVLIDTKLYNELTTDITIPGLLMAEKDAQGLIWQTKLALRPQALRSGLHTQFEERMTKIQGRAQQMTHVPMQVFINGSPRRILPLLPDAIATANQGVALLTHCFLAQELYLQ